MRPLDSSPLAAASQCPDWLEFFDWLEGSLEDRGLDAVLYSRCVVSILRQPLDRGRSVDREGEDDEWGGAEGDEGSDSRRRALLECLASFDADRRDVERFVGEILRRFDHLGDAFPPCPPGRRAHQANENVDSGVCPSPADGLLQNYDEAFPPLNDVEEKGARVGGGWAGASGIGGRSRAGDEAEVGATAGVGTATATGTASEGTVTAETWPRQPRPPPPGLEMPGRKRMKTEESRALRSCPAWPCRSQPVLVKKTAGQGSLFRASPQFVVPKFATLVSSAPAKIDVTRRALGGDLPFWQRCQQCSEWFCPVHKGAELSLLSARLSADYRHHHPYVNFQSLNREAEAVEMFDAPRFILQVISEDERGGGVGAGPVASSAAAAIASATTFGATSAGNTSTTTTSNSATAAPVPSISAVTDWLNTPYDNTPGAKVEFCLPRMNVGAGAPMEELPPQIHGIPISPNTHFVPIRSESMEEAYYPKPGFDEAGIGAWDAVAVEEGFFVLRQQHILPFKPLKFRRQNIDEQCQTELCGETGLGGEPEQRKMEETAEAGAVEEYDAATRGEEWLEDLMIVGRMSPEAAVEDDSGSGGGGRQIEVWQREDEKDEDALLRYVGNISLISPLESLAV